MTTLTSPKYATPETLTYQSFKKQQDRKRRKRRKSHNPGFIVSYPYATNYISSYLDPESWGNTDPDGTVTNITLDNPTESPLVGDAEIISGQLNIAVTANSFNLSIGEKEYFAVVFKNIDATSLTVRFRADTGVTGGNNTINFGTLTQTSGDAVMKLTTLSDGFYLAQFEYTAAANLTNCDVFSYVEGDGGQLYIQAAFFGANNDYPANVMPIL